MTAFRIASGIVSAVVAAMISTAPVQAQDLKIVTSMPSLGFPFFVHMQNALNAEAEVLGGIEIINQDGQNSAPKQTADLEAAIINQVSGVVIMTIDRRVDGVEGVLGHVGADNVIGGEAQANLIIKLFPDGASIVNLQGQPGASPAIDRNKGVHNILDSMSDKYVFVAEQTANFAREEGATVTESILAGLDSPPDVIVAANDDMALGALQVVQEQGLNIAILGFDALPEALASVRDGGLTATIEQSPGGQSRLALQALVKFLREGTKPEPLVLLEPFAITKDNIDKAERLSELN